MYLFCTQDMPHFFKQGVIHSKKLCLNRIRISTTNYIYSYVLFYDMVWQI